MELSLAVVGIDYANADKSASSRRFEMLLCVPGEAVELRREPKNKHDEHAVAVFSARGVQLGYLTAERAPFIGGKIAAGEEWVAVFQERADTAAIIRVRFGGGAPTLPPTRPVADHSGGATRMIRRSADDEFYPDPDGPMWGA